MRKILIANRGEIAVRIIRACQEMGIETVAIHSTADKDALHTKIADESVCIGPHQSLQSYLKISAIMSAAEITGVDAIHPGYGFLSENSDFAAITKECGIKFIGPSASQISLLGNKIKARELATKCDVPLLPGSHESLGDSKKACDIAKKIGFPVIIKAAAGGGGRGMKVVSEEKDFEKLLHLARKEAKACFGVADCFVEKYLTSPRHIEVQIVADEHGNTVAIGERDCSLQRRHQKIIEEAPCSILPDQDREKVKEYAVRLASYARYSSLGTVEFLYQDGRFYFMEMNTRVQVEHPVTEMITGIDLIKEQIKIAQGDNISNKLSVPPSVGHSLECRINAEDPISFTPSPGTVTAYHAPGGPGVRVDSSLYAGYRVPPYYDSLIAKIITHGKNRQESISCMQRALSEMKIEGISTNIALHQKILSHRDFIDNNLSTRFLDVLFKAQPHTR